MPRADPSGMSSHVSRGQSLKCKLQRALGDLSFICMTVFRIMNFILNVSQLAELSRSPLALLFLSSHCPCRRTLIQTQPPPYTVLMLHMGLLFLSLYCISLSPSLSHTLEYTALFFLRLHSQSDTWGSFVWFPWLSHLQPFMSQRRLTLEPHRKVDCINCKTLSLSLSPHLSFLPLWLLKLSFASFIVVLLHHLQASASHTNPDILVLITCGDIT